jgi:hypothetical protein
MMIATKGEMMGNRVAQWWEHLPELVKAIVFASVATIITTILFSGFFTVVSQAGAGIYIVNKYTGSVTYCYGPTCQHAPLGSKQ